MAGETQITVVGNLTADPVLKYTQTGTAVVNFTIASSSRVFDRESNSWKTSNTLFINCNAWRDFAENISESLTKGMHVIAQGRLAQRSYETKEGEKRTIFELNVDEVGPSLRRASAQVTKKATGDFQDSGDDFNQAPAEAPQAQGGENAESQDVDSSAFSDLPPF